MVRRTFALTLIASSLLVGCPAEDTVEEVVDTGNGGGTDTGAEADAGGGSGAEADSGTPDEERCVYPTHRNRFAFGEVVPDMYWEPAFTADGTETVFDLYEFHCNPEYDQYDTLVLLVSAGWCPNCPRMIQWVDALAERLEDEGALILYLEGQDTEGGPADSELSNEHFNQFTPNGSGIRVGDANNTPADGVVENVQAFPSTYVIRRSDMTIIADSMMSDYILPFVEIAMDPDADWSNPPAPEIVPEFPSNCEDGDEEATEPNDEPATATPIAAGDSLSGGICNGTPDFYAIDIEGEWTLTVEIATAGETADLDVGVIDPATGEIDPGPDGNGVGSFSTTTTETFTHTGPATVVVYGYNGSTSAYTITLE